MPNPYVMSVTADPTAGLYKLGDTISLKLVFNEPVDVTGIPELKLANGGTATYSGGGGSDILTFSYTVKAGEGAVDLDYLDTTALTLNGGLIDGSGYAADLLLPAPGAAGSLGANADLDIDPLAPTVAISSNAATLKAGETATITFTFSEDPGATFTWDGAVGDVVVSGGTLGAISGTGLTRSATFTPDDDVNAGTASITVTANSYADQAGNLGAGGPAPSLTFDTLRPAAPGSIALDTGSNSGSPSDTITNDATPTIVGTADLNTTVKLYDTDGVTELGSGATNGSGIWSITASALSEGTHTLVAKTLDGAGNVSDDGVEIQVTIDNTAPTADIDLADTALTSGQSTTVTVTFSEAVTGFDISDLSFANGTLSNLTTSDNITYTATLTAASGVEDPTNIITLHNGFVIDLAGNAGSGTTLSPNYAIGAPPPPEPEPEPEPGVVTIVTPNGNQVTGDIHNNLLASSGGADTVSGGGGNDTVQGGSRNDVLHGNVGDDSIFGGGGADLAYGGQSDDFLHGNAGDDRLYGDKGEDIVVGGQGVDFIQGGQGGDYVSGDLGDDVVLGGQGDDQVFGGAGNDYLSGDLGADTLSGGAGADIFHSSGAAGLDLVTDFNQAEGDRVLLEPGTSYVLSQVGGDVHVTMSGGGELVLVRVQLSSLADGWISA